MMSKLVLFSEDKSFIPRLKPTWKYAVLLGIPLAVAGLSGVYYYFYHRKCSTNLEVLSAPKTPSENAVILKNRGNKYFHGGKYEQAIKLYNEGLAICPENDIQTRAALYQNRAAAKENVSQYESAIEDCTAALDLSPRYAKALGRRAHLYQRLDQWDACLLDITACCVFEKFDKSNNVNLMDQALRKIGQMKAKLQREKLPTTLPSVAFIRNYFRAFAWDPFEKLSGPTRTHVENGGGLGSSDDEAQSSFDEAYIALNRALREMHECNYEKSRECVLKAIPLFEKVLTAHSSSASNPDGDEVGFGSEVSEREEAVPDHNVSPKQEAEVVDATEDSGLLDQTQDVPNVAESIINNVATKTVSKSHTRITEGEREQARAALNRARLLSGTYLGLCGYSHEAKQLFQSIYAPHSGADRMVRVNALIKSACLSMSVDQDLAACLYEFQNAQEVCPDCPDVYLHRGQIYLLADQLDQALLDLNSAVRLKPEFSAAHAQRLYTMYRQSMAASNAEKVDQRVNEFERLVQKYPSCLETLSLYAQILTERGDFQGSDEQFARVMDLAPDFGLPYAHRGLLYLRFKQDRDSALKWFSEGAKADPKCELIHELLGQFAFEQGHFDQALEHFDRAIAEVRTENDLTHLFALREGVLAQMRVSELYNVSVYDIVSDMRKDQMQKQLGMFM